MTRAVDWRSSVRLGTLLTLLLAAMVLPLLWRDHQLKLAAAEEQATAHAVGLERLLFVKIRNIERALAGLVGDAAQLQANFDGDLSPMLAQMAHDVDARHDELDQVLVVDAQGHALIPGRGDPFLPHWYSAAPALPGSELRAGPIERGDDGQRLMPLALPMRSAADGGPPGWALTRLRLGALQRLVEELPLGEHGAATLLDRNGVVLARSNAMPDQLGQRHPDFVFLRLIEAGQLQGVGEVVSRIDGVRRLRAYRALENYPFVVSVGLGRRDVLAPWYPFAWLALFGAGAYSLAWAWLLRRERRQAARHAGVLNKLAEVERQYHFVFEHSPMASWIHDRATLAFLEVNSTAETVFGYSREQFLAMSVVDLHPGNPLSPARPRSYTPPPDGASGPREYRRHDGSIVHAIVHGANVEFAGRPARLVLIEDVSERMRLEQVAEFQASHDELTGLPNRAAFTEALSRKLQQGGTLEVAVLDFNQFQLINDSLGHAIGDAVLAVVGQRLRDLAAQPFDAARLGGDEFALCLPITAQHGSADILMQLMHTLCAPIEAMGTLTYLTPNIGVAACPEHAADPEALVKRASVAMHEAKRRPGATILRFSATFEQASDHRLETIGRLHRAIEQQEFELYFQPQCTLASGQPSGVEALLRWRDPQRGLVMPNAFIGLCESSGLIVPLGRWVLRESCRCRQLLVDAGWPALTVAVNVSALQFVAGDFVADIAALVREFDLPPGAIELELTESIIMENPDQAIERMQALRALGMRLSIDDFGTGYSSMAYLRRLPVDKLKIDRGFVTAVDGDPHNAAICDAVLALARSFSLSVIAEGVETSGENDWLLQHGCDAAQGYLRARPMPIDALLGWLSRQRAQV
jgi:diguanylate cyclase (GGDEF)-like protein/PAS domain S-box-containing protein